MKKRRLSCEMSTQGPQPTQTPQPNLGLALLPGAVSGAVPLRPVRTWQYPESYWSGPQGDDVTLLNQVDALNETRRGPGGDPLTGVT